MNYFSIIFAFFLLLLPSHYVSAEEHKTLAEIWLAPEHKSDVDGIKEALKNHNIDRVTIQFVKIGVPGAIVAIGKGTPADSGRIAIELARIYNRKKIEFLIPESLVPNNYFAVGTSAYDESALIPVSHEDVLKLADPSLNDEAFHSLYLKLTHADQPYKKDYKRKFNNPR
jgi:hypothetical protein